MNPSFNVGSLELFGIALTWSRCGSSSSRSWCSWPLLVAMKATSFGLRMLAVVQNRRYGRPSMGIRTHLDRRADLRGCCSGSGSYAGVAGVALSADRQTSRRTSARATIIDSFLVVVFGGGGEPVGGTSSRRSRLGGVPRENKLVEPLAGAVLAKILILGGRHPLHPEAPQGPVRPQGGARSRAEEDAPMSRKPILFRLMAPPHRARGAAPRRGGGARCPSRTWCFPPDPPAPPVPTNDGSV